MMSKHCDKKLQECPHLQTQNLTDIKSPFIILPSMMDVDVHIAFCVFQTYNSSPYTNSIDAVSKHCGECFKTRKDKAKVIKHYKAKQNIIVQLQKGGGYVEKKTLLVCL